MTEPQSNSTITEAYKQLCLDAQKRAWAAFQVRQTTKATFTFETFTLDALHAAYRAAGMEGTPVPAQTWGVGAPIPCNIHFVIGRGYVECGR